MQPDEGIVNESGEAPNHVTGVKADKRQTEELGGGTMSKKWWCHRNRHGMRCQEAERRRTGTAGKTAEGETNRGEIADEISPAGRRFP